MSLTGDPDGRAVPRRHLGLRRDGRPARHHRRPRRAARTGDETGRGPARRGQPAVLGAVRAGQPDQRRTSPAASSRSGWATATRACSPTSRCPCADGELIITAGNDGQFRKLVEVLGVPELADDPRFARNEDRTANRDELRPLLVERLRTRHDDGVVPRDHRRRACRAGRSTPSTAASRSPSEVGLDPVVDGRRGRRARCRRCATRSRSPRRPPTTGCRRRRSTSTATRSARWLAEPAERSAQRERACEFPTSLGTSTADEIRLLGPGPDRRPDGQGRLRRARLLAGRAAPADARARPGCSRRCWSRWPTTASPRPRSPPGSPTCPRRTRCRARWPPACSAAGSRFLGRHRGLRRASCTTCSPGTTATLPDRRRRLGRARAGRRRPRTRAAGRFVPGLGHPVHKVARPAHAAC